MREIKFRAWNERHSDPKQRMMENVTVINSRVIMPDGDDWGIPIMQYTGLKDKNGKEIYEGDIVKENKNITSVEYGICGYSDAGIGFQVDPRETLEVIGNIYENPELLK